MNELRDDFAVDPTTGYIYMKPGYDPLTPTDGSQSKVTDAARKLMQENPGITFEEALKGAKADYWAKIKNRFEGSSLLDDEFHREVHYTPRRVCGFLAETAGLMISDLAGWTM